MLSTSIVTNRVHCSELLVVYSCFVLGQKTPDAQLSFSWLDRYHGSQTKETKVDAPVGNLLDLDFPVTVPPPLTDTLLFGGDSGAATIGPSNAMATVVEGLPTQQEHDAGMYLVSCCI